MCAGCPPCAPSPLCDGGGTRGEGRRSSPPLMQAATRAIMRATMRTSMRTSTRGGNGCAATNTAAQDSARVVPLAPRHHCVTGGGQGVRGGGARLPTARIRSMRACEHPRVAANAARYTAAGDIHRTATSTWSCRRGRAVRGAPVGRGHCAALKPVRCSAPTPCPGPPHRECSSDSATIHASAL